MDALNMTPEMGHSSASFDPNSFQLPVFEAPKAPDPPPKVVRIQQQLKREKRRPSEQSPHRAVLKKQLVQNESQVRTQALKTSTEELQSGLTSASEANPTQLLLKHIANLKNIYVLKEIKDLNTLSLLEPLLKCQFYKWKQLKENASCTPPNIESKLLQKLRQQSGILSPPERMALILWVDTLNKGIESAQTETPEPLHPPQTSREMLQLRSKKRRLNPNGTTQLEHQIQQLEAQKQHNQSLSSLKAKEHKWLKLIGELKNQTLTQAFHPLQMGIQKDFQYLMRIYTAPHPLNDLMNLMSQQFARLGIEDQEQFWQASQRKQAKILEEHKNPSIESALKHAQELLMYTHSYFNQQATQKEIRAYKAKLKALEEQEQKLTLLESQLDSDDFLVDFAEWITTLESLRT